MRITNKQQQEIDFLCNLFKVNNPTQEEIDEYIKATVLGIGQMSSGALNNGKRNRLFDAKRKLDINIKMWREDLTTGMLGADELKEDFNCEYGNKLVNSIINSVTPKYRMKVLKIDKPHTILALTNFPQIINLFQKLDNKIK